MYIIRLDDASEYMHEKNWNRMVALLDKSGIKPIIGIIPNNKDEELLKYGFVHGFWDEMRKLQGKGYTFALHGYEHRFLTEDSGINPVNNYSEFAGIPYEEQQIKIKQGYEILISNGINPKCFFAPAHTFDLNTLLALKNNTPIQTVVDTVAFDTYYENGFYFIPQQTGRARTLPFRIVTCCYHPNTMREEDFALLERFIETHKSRFVDYDSISLKKRKMKLIDKVLRKLYFSRR